MAEVLSLGDSPLANAYLAQDELDKPEIFAPLVVDQCQACYFVQLRHVVDPKILFSRYLYVSGTSPAFVAHFAEYAKKVAERFSLPTGSLVVDVGSNDGVLLSQFKNEGVKVLGIDPAENLAAGATKNGIPTIAKFFTPDTARVVAQEYGKAAIITANNVFAHTDDVKGFVEAVKELLAPDGAFVFEVQYLKDLVEKNLFDMVYHEHTCYYHMTPLVPFFDRIGLRVIDVERVPTHGGSLRVYVGWNKGPHAISPHVASMCAEESVLNTPQAYRALAERIKSIGEKLRAMLAGQKAAGKRIVGYGAPAKATTLCYALGIDGTTLEYIVDDAKLKQGRFMPGTHIPIKPSEALYSDKPDVCLILAWNFAHSIVKNHQAFKEQGGVFVVPVPEPKVVS